MFAILSSKIGKIIFVSFLVSGCAVTGNMYIPKTVVKKKEKFFSFTPELKKQPLSHLKASSLNKTSINKEDEEDLSFFEHYPIASLENYETLLSHKLNFVEEEKVVVEELNASSERVDLDEEEEDTKANDQEVEEEQSEQEKEAELNNLKITAKPVNQEESKKNKYWEEIKTFSIDVEEFKKKSFDQYQDLYFISLLRISFSQTTEKYPQLLSQLKQEKIETTNWFDAKGLLEEVEKNIPIFDSSMKESDEKINIAWKTRLSENKKEIIFSLLLKRDLLEIIKADSERSTTDIFESIEPTFYFLTPEQEFVETKEEVVEEEAKENEEEDYIEPRKPKITLKDLLEKEVESSHLDKEYFGTIVNGGWYKGNGLNPATEEFNYFIDYPGTKDTENIFKSTIVDPYGVSGFLKDKEPLPDVSTVTKAFGSPAQTNTEWQKLTKGEKTQMGDGTKIIESTEEDKAWLMRLLHQNCKTEWSFCHGFKATIPTPSMGITPHVAELIKDYQEGNKEKIPHFDLHKFKFPQLLPVIADGVKKSLDGLTEIPAPLSSNDSKKTTPPDPKVVTPPQAKTIPNAKIQFPNAFIREATFSAWGNQWRSGAPNYKDAKWYQPEYEIAVKSAHTVSLIIPHSQFKKHIVDKYTDDTEKPSFGFAITIPTTFYLQEIADNIVNQETINIKENLFLEELLNSGKITKSLGNFNFWHLLPDGLTIEKFCGRENKTYLGGAVEFFLTALLNANGDLKIEIEFKMSRLANGRNHAGFTRNWDVNVYKCPYQDVIHKSPQYKKIPSFFAISIDRAPELTVFKYYKPGNTESQITELTTEKLKEKLKTQTFIFDASKRQRKHFQNLMATTVKKEKDVPEYLERLSVVTSSWFSTSSDYFLTIFGKPNEKKPIPPTTFVIESGTEAKQGDSLTFFVAGLDSEASKLFFNSRHKNQTHQTVFMQSEYVKAQASSSGGDSKTPPEPKPPITNTYTSSYKDKSFYELSKLPFKDEVKIKMSEISTDKNKPTNIPFMFFVSLKNNKKYDDVQEKIKLIVDYVKKQVKKSNDTIEITDWKTKAKQNLKELDDSGGLSFGSLELEVYKVVEGQKTTIYLSTSLWGASYSKEKKTNSKPDAMSGSEGSVGFEVMSAIYSVEEKKVIEESEKK